MTTTTLKSKTATTFRKSLLDWFDKNKRDLPFRRTRNPYHVWLSEIMLQQTTMPVALKYFERFIAKYPTIASVAQANESDLLNMWQGLGYYSRIRNFQKACQELHANNNSALPTEFDELLKLKGVGAYTAAAIASICFQRKHAVLDGNVIRVLTRLLDYRENVMQPAARKHLQERADDLLSPQRPGDFNEAMMELGALICSPKSPKCLLCPVQKQCHRAMNAPEELPIKSKQKFYDVFYHSIVLHDGEHILLKKPNENSLIKNMWEVPTLYDLTKDQVEFDQLAKKLFGNSLKLLGNKTPDQVTVKHSITNKKIQNHAYTFESTNKHLTKLASGDFELIAKSQTQALPVNTLSKKVLKKSLLLK